MGFFYWSCQLLLGVSSSIRSVKFFSKKWMQVFLLHLSPFSERVLEKMGARIQMKGSACGAYLV